jgi:hypothetical protein
LILAPVAGIGSKCGHEGIGDILGHRSLESTCVYLHLGIAMLHSVALQVPTLSNALEAAITISTSMSATEAAIADYIIHQRTFGRDRSFAAATPP